MALGWSARGCRPTRTIPRARHSSAHHPVPRITSPARHAGMLIHRADGRTAPPRAITTRLTSAPPRLIAARTLYQHAAPVGVDELLEILELPAQLPPRVRGRDQHALRERLDLLGVRG